MPAILVENEIRNLAVGCLHVLYGKTVLNFPTTTRAHPSYWVFVNLGISGALTKEYKPLFPFRVWWKVWHTGIVPVVKKFWGRDLSSLGTYENAINILIAELTNQFRLVGLLPPGPTVELPDDLPGPWTGMYGNT